MLGRKHSLKGGEQIVLADYGPDEVTNTENQDLDWVNKVNFINLTVEHLKGSKY